jgi:hypothetical protein
VYKGVCFKRAKLSGNSDSFPPDCNVYNPRASWQESDYVALMRMFKDRPTWEQVARPAAPLALRPHEHRGAGYGRDKGVGTVETRATQDQGSAGASGPATLADDAVWRASRACLGGFGALGTRRQPGAWVLGGYCRPASCGCWASGGVWSGGPWRVAGGGPDAVAEWRAARRYLQCGE